MPSKKPRLWLYVDPDLKEALAKYAQEAGFSNEQAAAVAILKRWQGGDGGALSGEGNPGDAPGREHSQGRVRRTEVTNGALLEHSQAGTADGGSLGQRPWAPAIEKVRAETAQQVASVREEMAALRDGFATLAARLETWLEPQERATGKEEQAVLPAPEEAATAVEETEGTHEQPQDDGAAEAEEVDGQGVQGTGDDTPGADNTPQQKSAQGVTPAPRRRGRPGRSAAVEARGDRIFDGLVLALALAEPQRSAAVEALAQAERAYQESAYRIPDGTAPNWNTILKTNVALLKEQVRVRGMEYVALYPDADEPLTALVEQWCSRYSEVLTPETERLNRDYQAAVAERAAAPVAVNISELLRSAHHTLTQVQTGVPVRWEAVSVALGIATGRRMAEVHSSALLEPAGHHSVLFSGQLKTRSGTEAARAWAEQPVREIPTLVEAELVLAGIDWLNKHGQREKSVDDVNPRFAQRLSKFLLGLAHSPKLSYKNLRDLYVSACYKNALADGQAPESLQSIGQRVLGHGPLSAGATASYMKFTLAPGSLSRF